MIMTTFIWWKLTIGIYLLGKVKSLDVFTRIPTEIMEGLPAALKCYSGLEENESIDSIEWYHEEKLLYRYSSKDKEMKSGVIGPNIYIYDKFHKEEIDSIQMLLNSVNRDYSGTYRCKVTLKSPSLISNESTGELTVFQKENPELKVEKLKYSKGEQLRANCTSPRTNFLNNITWFINDKEIVNNRPETFYLSGNSFRSFKTFSSLEYDVVYTGPLKVHCSIVYSLPQPIKNDHTTYIMEKMMKDHTKNITDVEMVVNGESV